MPFSRHLRSGDDYLTIEISNPVATDGSRKKGGNQMALFNIRQRFELAYGSRADVDVDDGDDYYAVRLRFPEEHPA